jgi:uncharacterized membrane protein
MNELKPSRNLSTLEQAVSAGLGGFVLARYGGRSLVGTVLAVGLLQRAATGHCAVYQSLGVNTSDSKTPAFARPTVHLSKSVVIQAPPEKIYPFFSRDLERLVALSPEVLSLERIGTELSRWTVRTPIGKHTFDSRIIERQENRSLSWQCDQGRFPHRGNIELTPGARGTTLRVSMDYDSPGGAVAMHLSRLTGHEPHEALERALHNLQSLLEAGEIPQAQASLDNGSVKKEITR